MGFSEAPVVSRCVCQSAPVRALVVPVCCERGLYFKNSFLKKYSATLPHDTRHGHGTVARNKRTLPCLPSRVHDQNSARDCPLLSLKSMCGGGVPSSHPSLRGCLFLSFFYFLFPWTQRYMYTEKKIFESRKTTESDLFMAVSRCAPHSRSPVPPQGADRMLP